MGDITLSRKPVVDYRDFQRLLFSCQNDMRESSNARTGMSAFMEMNKLLLVKINEDRRERRGGRNRLTSALLDNGPAGEISTELFMEALSSQDHIGITQSGNTINLDENVLRRIVRRLEQHILVDESGNIYPPIVHAYESFVSTVFRGDNGQFFTPRNIVDFIIDIAGIHEGKGEISVIDPACGSGGFLVGALGRITGSARNENKAAGGTTGGGGVTLRAVGVDYEEAVARAAAANLSVHGDGGSGIFHGDSLHLARFNGIINEESFDFAVTNPPFSNAVRPGTRHDSDGVDILEKYELGHRHFYDPEENMFRWNEGSSGVKQQDSRVLFIERCHILLKPGGILGIVVDDGILNNPSDDYVRDYILRKFVVLAVISLPFDSFRDQGAHNFTSIMLLKKKSPDTVQGDIFMGMAKHTGEPFGKSTVLMPNDLENISKDYWRFRRGDRSMLSQFSFVVSPDMLEHSYDMNERTMNNRLDPKFYHPRRKDIEDAIERTGCAAPLSDVVEFKETRCPPEKVNSFGMKYIEKITRDGLLEYGTFTGTGDPKGMKDRLFHRGELVASRINLKIGMITIIPDDLDEILATGEYYRLEPRRNSGGNTPSIEYLRIVLSLEPIQFLMHASSSGQYGRIGDRELSKIRIPVPSRKVQERIVSDYNKAKVEMELGSRALEEMRKKSDADVLNRVFNPA